MGIMDNETFLPGVITEVEADYQYGYDASEFGSTDSVLVIGTAFSGPSGVEVPVYTPEHAAYMFGKSFDPKTKKEATLVAGIQDAYDKGARTIYAVRVGGKEVSRTFQLNTEAPLKLKVYAAYPSNEAKDFVLTYDHTEGNEAIHILKPASRATIVEKMQGHVGSENEILETVLKINQDYAFSKDSSLVDVIKIINEHRYNNVLRLGIVDRHGVDVTSTIEAQLIPLGALFPGAYLIGRDTPVVTADTDVQYHIVTGDAQKPYEGFEGLTYKELIFNTELTNGLPIFAKSKTRLSEALKKVGVYSKDLEFLKVPGSLDKAFAKDKVDYEEVGLSSFEIYKRLGSGYAITAQATKGAGDIPRVKETPTTNPNRIQPIRDGIYSMLENSGAQYRVLVAANADDKIADKIPRAKDFLVTSPTELTLLKGLIQATAFVDEKDRTLAKKYQFQFKSTEEQLSASLADKTEEIFSQVVIPMIPKLQDTVDGKPVTAANLSNGTVVAKEGTLGEFDLQYVHDGKFIPKDSIGTPLELTDGGTCQLVIVEENIFVKKDGAEHFTKATAEDLTAISSFSAQKYLLAESLGQVFVMKIEMIEAALADTHLTPVGDLVTLLEENEDETLIFTQSNHLGTNDVIVQSSILDNITLEEFVEILNKNTVINNLFSFSLTTDGAANKDTYVLEIPVTDELAEKTLGELLAVGIKEEVKEDRVLDYNYDLYIPYKTNDNFARQLAQHVTYTSLKTVPSHGFIGVNVLNNTTLTSIANHVDELETKEFDLYAKTIEGKNMLDKNNLPYSLGKNLSITAIQYPVTFNDTNYEFVSNGAAGYAGMVSSLPLESSSTNQPIAVDSLSFELSNYQLTRLTQKGYVTIRNSYRKGLVITDGITSAPVESPFRRLNISRITNAIEDLIREAAEPFIGQQNHAANKNSLQTAIKSKLDKLVDVLIKKYDFKLVTDPQVENFTYIDIDYNVVCINEIREVRNRIKVKNQ